MEGSLSVERRVSPDARCAFCHDALLADEAKAECAGCRTVLHRECREALPECPTLGCRHSQFTLRDVVAGQPRRPPRAAFRRALANVSDRRLGERLAREEEPGGDPFLDSPPGLVAWARALGPSRLGRIVFAPLSVPVLAAVIGIGFILGGRRRRRRFEDTVRALGAELTAELVLAPLLLFALTVAGFMGAWSLASVIAIPLALSLPFGSLYSLYLLVTVAPLAADGRRRREDAEARALVAARLGSAPTSPHAPPHAASASPGDDLQPGPHRDGPDPAPPAQIARDP